MRLRILTRDHTLGESLVALDSDSLDHNIDSWHGFRNRPALKRKVNPHPSSLSLSFTLTAPLSSSLLDCPQIYISYVLPSSPHLSLFSPICYFTFILPCQLSLIKDKKKQRVLAAATNGFRPPTLLIHVFVSITPSLPKYIGRFGS
jgi:hypothetical protein